MSTEANKAIARRYFEEFLHERKGIVGEDLDLFAPTYQRYFPGSPGPLDLKGHEHISITLCSAYADGRFTVEDTIAEGDKVVSRFTFRGTHQGAVLGIPPTGKQVTLTGNEIHRIVDGRIVEQWSQFDALALPSLGVLQRLGVAPTPGQ
jgi:predicted ester cyclase